MAELKNEVHFLVDNNEALATIQKALFVINMMRGKDATIGIADRYNRSIRQIRATANGLSLIPEVPDAV